MPKTTKAGEPRQEELPSTLRRSPKQAQETFAKAHDSALVGALALVDSNDEYDQVRQDARV